MLTNELESAVCAYERGESTLDDLRTAVVAHLQPGQDRLLFARLPDDAATGLVRWIETAALEQKGRILVGNFSAEYTQGEVDPLEDTSRGLFEHVAAAKEWLNTLDINSAIARVKADTFGDWYRDPWGWPELAYLAGNGRAHLLSRVLTGSSVAATAFDVPKSATKVRPAILLDLVDRVLYQACVDGFAHAIEGQLRPWVFGWRMRSGHATAHLVTEWIHYFDHLRREAQNSRRGWRTDISDFFASVDLNALIQRLGLLVAQQETTKTNMGARRSIEVIASLVTSVMSRAEQKGLPQRSTASSILANLLLTPLDEAAERLDTGARFARWLDDFWSFSKSDIALQTISREVQTQILSLGHQCNLAKTAFYEGEALDHAIDRLNLSYVDAQLRRNPKDTSMLDPILEEMLRHPHAVDRHEISFVSSRIKQHRRQDLAARLASAHEHFAFAADLIAPVFLKCGLWRDLVDWCETLLKSTWLPWIKTTFLRMYPRTERLPARLLRSFADASADQTTPELVRVMAISRVAKWTPPFAREVIDAALQSDMAPLTRRGYGLAAVAAGLPPKVIRRFLLADNATVPLAEFLSSVSYDKNAIPLRA